jgi:hypothetical protein
MDLIPKHLNKSFDFSCLNSKNLFVLGIGGGSDVVGAYAIARIIQKSSPSSQISYGLCISYKNDYSGFTKLNENLYVRSVEHIENPDDLHTSLALVIKMEEYDRELEPPFLIARPPKYDKLKNQARLSDYNTMVQNSFENAINFIKPDLIIAVDLGGDSLTCGVEDEYSFDRTGLRALKQIGSPFIYIVLGPGCDGKSTIEMLQSALAKEISFNSFIGEFSLDEVVKYMKPVSSNTLSTDRTPNIISNAKSKIHETPELKNAFTEIPRHRKPTIPIEWLIKGIAFDGLKLSIN